MHLAADEVRRLGYAVIYGDTDSVFVHTGEESAERAEALALEILAAVSATLARRLQEEFAVTSHLELEFEKCYRRFFMPEVRQGKGGSKKRYAGLLVEVLVGERGLLTLTPIVGVAIAGLLAERHRLPALDLGVPMAVLGAYLLFASGWVDATGGWSPGTRHLLPAIPFLAGGAAVAWSRWPRLSTAAAVYSGVKAQNLHFLDLPFYETGRVRKRPLGEEDIRIVADLLREVRPHQVYAAGDLSDPHGTHRVCLAAVFAAFEQLKGEAWLSECEVWLYRGAWQEWEVGEIEMAVPLSPGEVQRKRIAIFKHESQKDKALFPGVDEREFWQRAEERNHETARKYDQLGLAEYQAIEGFVRWNSGNEE